MTRMEMADQPARRCIEVEVVEREGWYGPWCEARQTRASNGWNLAGHVMKVNIDRITGDIVR